MTARSKRWRGARHWLLDSAFPILRPPRSASGPDRNFHTRQIVERAIADAGGPSAPVGKIIAELNFGFWRSLTARTREHEMWVPYVRHAFARGTARHDVDDRMQRLRELRNRIAHHEAILGRDLQQDLAAVLQLCEWISPPVARYVDATSAVPALLSSRP